VGILREPAVTDARLQEDVLMNITRMAKLDLWNSRNTLQYRFHFLASILQVCSGGKGVHKRRARPLILLPDTFIAHGKELAKSEGAQ
jgi:hypothetical protein